MDLKWFWIISFVTAKFVYRIDLVLSSQNEYLFVNPKNSVHPEIRLGGTENPEFDILF